MHVQRYNREDLLRAADGTLRGGAAPRLPAPPFLGFDEVHGLSDSGGAYGCGGAHACKSVASLDWVFSSHFQGDPVLPGALMLDALLQLTGFHAGALGFTGRGRAVRVGATRFLREVTPHAKVLEYRIDILRVLRKRQTVIANGTVVVDGVICLTASDLIVCILHDTQEEVCGESLATEPALLP